MDDRIVPERDLLLEEERPRVSCDVKRAVVLHVRAGADADVAAVAAHDGGVPDRDVVPEDDVADDRGRLGQEDAFAELRGVPEIASQHHFGGHDTKRGCLERRCTVLCARRKKPCEGAGFSPFSPLNPQGFAQKRSKAPRQMNSRAYEARTTKTARVVDRASAEDPVRYLSASRAVPLEAPSRSCLACARAGSPTAAPARRAATASTRPRASRTVTRVRVRPPEATFSTARCVTPDAATCGRCVTTRICSRAASARSFRPTASAVAPETPASTSSKTNVRPGPRPPGSPRPSRGRLLLGESGRERELDAREFAARRDLRERPRRLAGVRAKENVTASIPQGPNATGSPPAVNALAGSGRRPTSTEKDARRKARSERCDSTAFPSARRRRRAGLREPERGATVGREGLLRGVFGLPHGSLEVRELVALAARAPPASRSRRRASRRTCA